MKKYIVIYTLFFITSALTAQNLSVGFKDGFSATNARFRNDGGYLYKFENKTNGRNSGIVANYEYNTHLSFQTELSYLGKGFGFYRASGEGGGYRGDYKLDYISIPLLCSYVLGNKIKYYGYAGIYLDFFLSVENHNTSTSLATSKRIVYDHSYDANVDFNKTDLGYAAGLGIKFPICDKVDFFIDGRYTSGLTRSVKEDREDIGNRIPESLKDIYNYTFSINWGILFKPIGLKKNEL